MKWEYTTIEIELAPNGDYSPSPPDWGKAMAPLMSPSSPVQDKRREDSALNTLLNFFIKVHGDESASLTTSVNLIKLDIASLNKILNDFGENGWELATVFKGDENKIVAIFKRQK